MITPAIGTARGKLPLQPHDIERLLGARTCASAPLALLMRPRLDAGDGVPRMIELDRRAAERELTANVRAFRSELAPGNWSGWFPMRSDPAADDRGGQKVRQWRPVHRGIRVGRGIEMHSSNGVSDRPRRLD